MQNLANTAWSFASSRLPHDPLFAAISAAAIRKLHGGSGSAAAGSGCLGVEHAQSIANTAWAFAVLQVRHEPLMDAIAEEVLKNIPASGLVGLGLPWSLWRSGHAAVPWRLAERRRDAVSSNPCVLQREAERLGCDWEDGADGAHVTARRTPDAQGRSLALQRG
uniref:Uncharacterized protein n=1 Tax=Alexandrium monilatum TaxID=311494 RepID=A0A6T1CEJ3_9DINO